MELDARKQKILKTVIDLYIATGEPVGSKAVAEHLDISVSSATIRNEMSALDSLGYLQQPHTSAGRIPSYAGYRFYIDRLMNPSPISEQEKTAIQHRFLQSGHDPQKLLESAGLALADITGCTAISTTPSAQSACVNRIDIVPVGKRTYLILIITSADMVHNRLCRSDSELSPETLEFFARYVNDKLCGVELDAINLPFMQTLAAGMGEYSLTLSPMLFSVCEMARELSGGQVILEGQSNLLNHRELDDSARGLLRLMAQPQELLSLVQANSPGVRVVIGSEIGSAVLNDASVILSPYQTGENAAGVVGIIGPTRLDYRRVIPHIEYFAQLLGRFLGEPLD